ncbi:unnamed protein product [Jaminaea pallidilutea]
MGLFGSSGTAARGPLPPAPHPIGVSAAYTSHGQEVPLRVRERKISFSGDDFTVKDALTGNSVFKVEGKSFSLSGRKTVHDASGKALFTIRKKHFALKPTYYGEDSQSEQTVFTVASSVFTIGTKLKVVFKNTAGRGEEMKLELRGDLFDRKAEITMESGQPVARVSRDFVNAGQLFFDKQTYVLTVAPGVDTALLLAICVCLDEVANDSDGK